MTTDQQLSVIRAQCYDIVACVGYGSLDPVAVKQALQDIIDRKSPARIWRPPTWWRTPEQQLERARELWPDAILPEPPKEFMPETDTEVLLLHVPDSFRSLWDKVVPPEGYFKYRDEALEVDERDLVFAPNKVKPVDPLWVAFDPEHGRYMRPNSFWHRPNIADGEVLSALIQFPDWPLKWRNGASAPYMGGYRIGSNWGDLLVPHLFMWTNKDPQLAMLRTLPNSRDPQCSTPTVREC